MRMKLGKSDKILYFDSIVQEVRTCEIARRSCQSRDWRIEGGSVEQRSTQVQAEVEQQEGAVTTSLGP